MALDLKALTLTAAQLRKATPVEIDERLYRATRELNMSKAKAASLRDLIAKSHERREKDPLYWTDYSQQRLDEAQAQYERVSRWAADLDAWMAPLRAEHTLRGGWTRAHLCITNGRGHVHADTYCRTLYPTSKLDLVWQVSGMTEAEIVEAAGERACTVCYPSAPVDVLKRPTTIFSEDEQAKQAARDEREAKRAAKAAKAAAGAITNPDGTPLRSRLNDVIRTEREAQIDYTGVMAELATITPETEQYYHAGWRAEMVAYTERLAAALAHKRGQSVEEFTAEMAPKVTAKARLYAREAARFQNR